MPKVLTEAQVRSYHENGFLSPVRAMSEERARGYRERFEALEARVSDIKKMKIIPRSTFYEHKMEPHPGLQIDVDGELGTVMRVSGGRVMVNFNHPLSGKEVIYEVQILRKVTEPKEQIAAYLNRGLRIPAEKIKVEISGEKSGDEGSGGKATVLLPFQLPAPFTGELGKKIAELTGLKEVVVGNG